MKLANTRAILDAVHSGSLAGAKTVRDPVFGFDVVTECPGFLPEILLPREGWADAAAYDATAWKLAVFLQRTLRLTKAGVGAEVKAAGPSA